MKRPPRPEELRLWGMVADTVHARLGDKPLKLRAKVKIKPVKAAKAEKTQPTYLASIAPLRIDPAEIKATPAKRPKSAPGHIEPNRRKRLIKEHDPIGARLDMHGFDQDQARPALEAFIRRAYEDRHRAVLVITGKGKIGHGVLKKRTPEWLASPGLREMIAGVSQADQRHGGEGALYVALKRRS
ncbi:Smr/MutS family protein [Caulobacter sp. DWR1-3-2b1]|uniref:Smr/MutS family protein n=1 Tax=Caulobacter sp. DWR1-3-2b1 TaxID=2804670 RepID=UPI003CE68EDB